MGGALLLRSFKALLTLLGAATLQASYVGSSWTGRLKSDAGNSPARPAERQKPIKPPRTDGGHALLSESSGRWDHGHELHRLKSFFRRNDDETAFHAASNLARYLGLRPVSSLHMPIPVHIIFIGFKGDGNLAVKIDNEEISEWFDHLDHIIPHIYVPEADLQCEEDGACGGWHHPSRGDAFHSHIHYNLSCHAVELGDEASAVFERAIQLFSRPVDPTKPGAPQQVDAALMEEFVSDFLYATGLHMSYSVIVMNPKWDPTRPKYGYRMGLSGAEASFLADDPALRAKAFAQPFPKPERNKWKPGKDAPNDPYGWDFHGSTGDKFGINEKLFEAKLWVRQATGRLDEHEGRREAMKQKFQQGQSSWDNAQLATRLEFFLRLSRADKVERQAIDAALDSGASLSGLMAPEEGCLVNTWVGRGRWVLVDLTASAEEWGPHGQAGTKHSLPSVDAFFPSVGSGMGRASSGLDAGSTMPHTRRSLLLVDSGQTEEEAEDGELAALESELEFIRYHYRKNCEGVDDPDENCKVMLEEEADLERELAAARRSASRRRAVKGAGLPEDSVGLQERANERLEELQERMFGKPSTWQGGHGSGAALQRSQDLFLAQVGSLLSSAIRHALVPPTSTWNSGNEVWSSSNEVRLPTEVKFQIYLVSDLFLPRFRKGQVSQGGFDASALRRELDELVLPGQRQSVDTHPLFLADDPALAVSLAVSLRSASLAPSGMPVLSVDSQVLHNQIQHRILPDDTRGRRSSHQENTREVPIFVFQVLRDIPVVIDGHLLAKSLPDMVLVVHNMGNASNVEHPAGVACGGRLVSQCRTSSLQASVQAVARHMAGALPPHMGFSPVHDAVTHDWTWAVGSHAMSLTSPGWEMGQMTRDIVFRSYALRVLDASLHTTNQVIQNLREETPHQGAFPVLTAGGRPLTLSLVEAYSSLVDTWTRTMKAIETKNFAAMFKELREVETLTETLTGTAAEMHHALHPSKCIRRRKVHLNDFSGSLSFMLLGAGGLGCWWAYRRGAKGAKPHIN